jgi:hypothetical protein
MPDQKPTDSQSTTDQILDLLLDALVERQRARRAGSKPAEEGKAAAEQAPAAHPPSPRPAQQRAPTAAKSIPAVPPPRPDPPTVEQQRPATAQRAPSPMVVRQPPPPKLGEAGWEPPPRAPSINMAKTLGRLLLLVVVLLVLVNVPVNRWGVSLARILPDSAALVIRDGLVLKGSGPEIYILEDDQLRWISSMDAFEHLGLTWEDVHVVEDEFLNKFEKGRPIHVLLKCGSSPHIYRLENQEKRWIKDIDTFLAEGHVWEDVRFVSCQYLRDLPNGPSIPEDAGPPPEP